MAQFNRLMLLLLSVMALAKSEQERRIIPESYRLNAQTIFAANGSSSNGHCSNVTLRRDRQSMCNDPSSSVLFDGVIPTLSGLDGDNWASQFMILKQPEFGSSSFFIYPDFSTIPGGTEVGRVEVTIFNCPQWGTGVDYFRVYNGRYVHAYSTTFSCDSLLRLCLPTDATRNRPVSELYFSRYRGNHGVHIAEIAFYNNSEPCPIQTLIPGANNTDPTSTTITSTTTTTANTDICNANTTAAAIADNVQVELQVSTLTQSVLIILVVIIILQASVLFMVVIFLLGRKHRGRKPEKAPLGKKDPEIVLDVEEELYEMVEDSKPPLHARGQGKKEPRQQKSNPYHVK